MAKCRSPIWCLSVVRHLCDCCCSSCCWCTSIDEQSLYAVTVTSAEILHILSCRPIQWYWRRVCNTRSAAGQIEGRTRIIIALDSTVVAWRLILTVWRLRVFHSMGRSESISKVDFHSICFDFIGLLVKWFLLLVSVAPWLRNGHFFSHNFLSSHSILFD